MKTPVERQRKYLSGLKSRGYDRVTVIVPATMKNRLANYARKLCKEYERG